MKHPGREAQGHRLAALIKTRKEELKQNRNTAVSSVTIFTSHSTLQSNSTVYYGVGALAAIALGSVGT